MPYATRIREREPDAQSACGRTENKQRDAFVHEYLKELVREVSRRSRAAGHTEQRAGHAVTNFNIPLTVEGYVYAAGPTVVVASVAPGPPPAAAEDALTEMASLR